jgi:phenylacetate-CoA ligase
MAMTTTHAGTDQAIRQGFADREAIHWHQQELLVALIKEILPQNPFYTRKFKQAGIDGRSIRDLGDLANLPFTFKSDLAENQAAKPPYGDALTYSLERYCRLHQTSGTLGQPLRWLDTQESWDALVRCWQTIFQICGLGQSERLFFPFSFGPFIGFWTAFEAASRQGYLCLPGGGMSTTARLRFLVETRPTVVLCTPTYALHLAEVSRQENIDLTNAGVRYLIVAGEPGGSIPATRARIETGWGARVFDHNGLTEVGVLGIECPENPAGLHLLESDYIVEVIDPASGRAASLGSVGELAVTNLRRRGSPVIRYRTGDVVRIDPRPCPCGRQFVRLDGGILGRTDDMIHLRGNNLYPAALEAVVRRFSDVAEYRVVVDQTEALAQLRLEIESLDTANGAALAHAVARAIRDELLFRAEVTSVPFGSLPRYEMKARRVTVRNKASESD